MSVPTPETQAAPMGRLAGLRARYATQLSGDTAKAAGLAGAMIVTNVIALGSTVVFARELSDYGALAALISYYLILTVAGQALQVATAREGVLGHLGVGPGLIATLRAWTRTMAIFTLVATVISVALSAPIASLVGVPHERWAAAIGLPAGCVYLELSILRGALQGVGDYKAVGLSLIGEQGARLIAGALLAIGLAVTGAYFGTPLSLIAMGAYCAVKLRGYSRTWQEEHGRDESVDHAAALTLGRHVARAWAPIAGLVVIAVLQNIDIIAAKHRFGGHGLGKDLASSYAATAVAAKVLVWVAMGAGFYLVPEVSRRRAAGEDTRPVLAKAVGIILVCSVPVLLIFAFGSHQLLSAVFKKSQLHATSSLFPLGVAFTVLACTYLAIQYLLALKRTWFLVFLAPVALAEPFLLALLASRNPSGFATFVLGIQAVGAVVAFGLALWRPRTPAARAITPEPA